MKRALKWIKRYLCSAGLTLDEFRQLDEEIIRSNRQSMRIFSLVSGAFLLAMFAGTFFYTPVADNRWVYFGGMAVSALAFGASRLPWTRGRMLLVLYVFLGGLFAMSILTGTVLDPEELSVSFIAILLTAPMLFVDRPCRMVLTICLAVLGFSIIVMATKEPKQRFVDIMNAVVFGAISAIISTYMMGVKCKRYLYEQQVIMLSRTDLLTGLLNRNAFEQSLSRAPGQCRDSLACVYVDVNGLHELNNARGHEAGDEMLRRVAGELQRAFGTEHSYRVGGDEMLAFVPDCPEDALNGRIDRLRRAVEQAGDHISVGCARQPADACDMNGLVRCAEQRMYEDKRAFYQQRGIDRRSRS
ncbi:MAG: GGDEF domain-containing protein [Candidatus Ventricola sp.]